jgi:hypothetical protein
VKSETIFWSTTRRNQNLPPQYMYYIINNSARCPRSEVELRLHVDIHYSIPGLLVVRVQMSEPADTTSRDCFQIRTLGVQKGVIFLSRRVSERNEHQRGAPTDSSAMLATAFGLFGSTPGYVTDGHPFFVVEIRKEQHFHVKPGSYPAL